MYKWLTTSYRYIIIDDIIEALTVLSIWYRDSNQNKKRKIAAKFSKFLVQE